MTFQTLNQGAKVNYTSLYLKIIWFNYSLPKVLQFKVMVESARPVKHVVHLQVNNCCHVAPQLTYRARLLTLRFKYTLYYHNVMTLFCKFCYEIFYVAYCKVPKVDIGHYFRLWFW